MMEAFAVTEFPLLEGLLKDFAGLARAGIAVDANSMNYAVSMARGINPQDPTEALIASQMAAIHYGYDEVRKSRCDAPREQLEQQPVRGLRAKHE